MVFDQCLLESIFKIFSTLSLTFSNIDALRGTSVLQCLTLYYILKYKKMFPIISVVFHNVCQILQHWVYSISYGSHECMLLIALEKHKYSFVSMPLKCLIFVSMLLLAFLHSYFLLTDMH